MKSIFMLLLWFVAAWAFPSQPQKPIERIVGGVNATQGEFPSIVSIRIGTHMCGGSILNANWIITAAHCATYEASLYTIVAGEHYLNSPDGTEQSRTVGQIIVHPGYNAASFEGDVALMQLKEPFSLATGSVQPVVLADKNYSPGGQLTAAGWGTRDEYEEQLSNVLQKVDVSFVTDSSCKNSYGGFIRDGMICAGSAGKDSCQGDSGGPLLNQDAELTGLVSWGIGCGTDGYPGVYTSIPYFFDWITKTIT